MITSAGDILRASIPGSIRWVSCLDCRRPYPILPGVDGCPHCHPAPVPEIQRPKSRWPLGELERGGINVHAYQSATLESWDASDDGHLPGLLREWLAEWDAAEGPWPSRPWLYIYGAGSQPRPFRIGALGNGKTMAAVGLVRYLLETERVRPGAWAFRTAEGLLLECEATFREEGGPTEQGLLKRYGALDLLVIDDVGVRAEPRPHAIRILDEITKRREGRATIWTSNLSPKTLAAADPGFERIVSRIAGECGDGGKYAIKLAGRDRRVERSK